MSGSGQSLGHTSELLSCNFSSRLILEIVVIVRKASSMQQTTHKPQSYRHLSTYLIFCAVNSLAAVAENSHRGLYWNDNLTFDWCERLLSWYQELYKSEDGCTECVLCFLQSCCQSILNCSSVILRSTCQHTYKAEKTLFHWISSCMVLLHERRFLEVPTILADIVVKGEYAKLEGFRYCMK